jgi:hypothetical protein
MRFRYDADMPTIIRQGGFRVVIYTDDHAPPHVHVFYGNEELLVSLGSGTVPVGVRTNRDMKPQRILKALRLVADNQALLLERWREIHG